MRSHDPDDKYDVAEAGRLGAEPWMLAALGLNPDYCAWGPYEDYMWKKGADEEGGGHGWDTRVILETFDKFWDLDDLNEVVHFYFDITRANEDCDVCTGNGYHPDAQWISESFYEHSSPFKTGRRDIMRGFAAQFQDREFKEVHGPNSFPTEETLAKYGAEFREFCEAMRTGNGYWNDKITQDEADALEASGRLTFLSGAKWDPEKREHVGGKPVTAAQVNAVQRPVGINSHDGINRGILIEARLERLDLPRTCPKCEGHGSVFTEPEGHLGLVLWVLHPRKGCSRGVHIKHLDQEELPKVYALLRGAAKRNAERFSKIPGGPV